ncbi:tetratricopeptide repeat protein [Sorangium sp. So ce1128]
MPRAVQRVALLAMLLVGVACATTRSEELAEGVATMKAEHSADKLVARGRAFAAVGDYTRAEQYLAAALDAGAEPRVVLPILLKVCVAEKRYHVAIDYAEPVLKKRPDDHHLRFIVGSLHAAISETKAAREQFETLLEKMPAHAEAHYALALLLQNKDRDPAAAARHFRAYVQLKPDGPHAEEARGSMTEVSP